MKKIGIVELYSGKSGKHGFYNSQEIGLCKSLVKLGYKCYVFYPCCDIENIREDFINNSITIVYCPGKKLGIHGKFDWNILLGYSLDFIQCNTDNQLFVPGLVSFCNKHSIPLYHYVGVVGSDSSNIFNRIIMNFLYKFNLRLLQKDKVFVKTSAVYRKLKQKNVRNITIAPVGLDTSIIPETNYEYDNFKKCYGIPINKKLILFVGRIDEYKKPLSAVDIIKRLDDDYFLIIIGKGMLDSRLSNYISLQGLDNRIKWIKEIPNKDIHKFYKISDYFINLNDKEIFGMSILEAMYQNCSVIAFHAPGPDEIIVDKKTGFLVDDINEICEIISSRQKVIFNEPKKSILDRFTWDNSARIIDGWISKS